VNNPSNPILWGNFCANLGAKTKNLQYAIRLKNIT
jgi:hypothetical protein